MTDVITDVWCLESEQQIAASGDLSRISDFAIAGHRKSQNYLKKLWDEKWPGIKEKLLSEGSVWYVWWMDGVNQHIANTLLKEKTYASDC